MAIGMHRWQVGVDYGLGTRSFISDSCSEFENSKKSSYQIFVRIICHNFFPSFANQGASWHAKFMGCKE